MGENESCLRIITKLNCSFLPRMLKSYVTFSETILNKVLNILTIFLRLVHRVTCFHNSLSSFVSLLLRSKKYENRILILEILSPNAREEVKQIAAHRNDPIVQNGRLLPQEGICVF